jgi:hypothetical protein
MFQRLAMMAYFKSTAKVESSIHALLFDFIAIEQILNDIKRKTLDSHIFLYVHLQI